MSSSGRIFSAQEKILNECISSLKGKTPNQMKTLTGTILPRVALYKAFQSDSEYEPRAYELVREYMIEVIGGLKHLGFTRTKTLASGGPYCDCGYKKKTSN